MKVRKADKPYIFPRLGNPYDLYLGIPITYSKRKVLEIAREVLRRTDQRLANTKLQGRIILKTHKVKKMYDNFYNLLVTPKRFETSKERQYVCWGIPLEHFESEEEYKKHIEIKLKTLCEDTNKKKSLFFTDKKDKHHNKKMKIFRKRFYKNKIYFSD